MKRKPPKRQEEATEWSNRPLVLRLYPDTVLRETCQPVGRFDSSLRDFTEEMHILMQRCQGIGLAAPQVGVLSRVIAADIGEGPVFVVNPEIIERGDSDIMAEGCLSLPGTQIEVRRACRIEIKGWNLDGKAIHSYSDGLLARVLQHEVDHLNGVLILDHASPLVTNSDMKTEGCDENRQAPSV